jgi:hypothetical protein
MDIQTNRASRPSQVTVAITLLTISSVLGSIKMGIGAHLDNPLTYVVLAVVLALMFLLIWLIYRGKNWARWMFMVVFVLGLLVSPRSLQRLIAHSTFGAVFFCFRCSFS